MKIGFTCSTFDLFHAGHVMMLKEASTVCEYLIVGLQTDPTIDRPNKNKPVQSVLERYIQLKACKYVDEILVYETEADLLNLIKTQTMHIRFLSEEYLNRDFTGKQYCMDNNITFNECFTCKNSYHPAIMKLFLRKDISIETLVILNRLNNFTGQLDTSLSLDLIWPDVSRIIKKYTPFLPIKVEKYDGILRRVIGRDQE